ncbi:MAG TPA: hypothetical protein VMK65_12650 [Longimicrobiales bacterium]|nr:hypothetical protein [Longimicrobiales bacterium]
MARLYVTGGPIALQGDTLFLSEASPHRILSFGLNGRGQKLIAADSGIIEAVRDDFLQVGRERGKRVISFAWSHPQSRGIFKLPSGLLLNVITFKEEGASVWQVYAEGELVAQERILVAYRPWSVTENGNILASAADPHTGEERAVRLRLEVRPPPHGPSARTR